METVSIDPRLRAADVSDLVVGSSTADKIAQKRRENRTIVAAHQTVSKAWLNGGPPSILPGWRRHRPEPLRPRSEPLVQHLDPDVQWLLERGEV